MPRGKVTKPALPAAKKIEVPEVPEVPVVQEQPAPSPKKRRPVGEPLPPIPMLSPDFKYGRSKAIKLHCRQCNCGNIKAGKECTIRECALWPYRGGLNDVSDDWKSFFHGWMKQRLAISLVGQDQEQEKEEDGDEE
jgi:hypothetical protein